MSTFGITVKGEHVVALRHAVSKNKSITRGIKCLSGMIIYAHKEYGVFVLAGSRHYIASFRVCDWDCAAIADNFVFDGNSISYAIPIEMLKTIKAIDNVNIVFNREADYNKQINIATSNSVIQSNTVNCDINFSKLFDVPVSGEVGHFNLQYLGMFHKVIYTIDKKANIVLHQNGTTQAYLTVEKIPQFLGMIMPIKMKELPELIKPWEYNYE